MDDLDGERTSDPGQRRQLKIVHELYNHCIAQSNDTTLVIWTFLLQLV